MNKVKVTRRLVILGGLGILLGTGFVTNGDKYFKIAQQLDIFSKVYKEINRSYADEVDPTLLMRKAIDTMMASLDPYTVFISESRIEDAKFIRTGQYSGVGADIYRMNGTVVVRSVVQNGPADLAGIKPGDRLIEIDDEASDSTRSMAEIEYLLQGEQGSVVKLSVERDEEVILFDVTRDYVEALQSSVPYYGLTNDSIGYVKLTVFNESAARDLKAALETLAKEHPSISGVILDLRANPGGRVDQAINILNLFLPKDENVLDMKGRSPQHTRSFSTQQEPWNTDIPLAILINEHSASASEIVAGAIQDFDRGVLVGQKSFGKGLVQNVRPLSYNTQFKITVAKYYTPSGRCIQAIDYSSDAGGVKLANDAIETQQVFKTRNGREVYDGAGIDPDIEVALGEKPAILRGLISKGIIFNFITDFVKKHDTIAAPANFQISETLYSEFVSYVNNGDFTYTTSSERSTNEFLQLVDEKNSWDKLKTPLDDIQSTIVSMKTDDLEEFKEEISNELKTEILRRYYYESGVTEASFSNDPVVVKASKILLDEDTYQSELTIP